jgi:hypothetical protein
MRSSLALILLLLATPSFAAINVDTCGQVVSGDAVLIGDLDCSAYVGNAVTLDSGRLDLGGFTLIGGDGDGVHCNGSCSVFSSALGGTVRDATGFGIIADGTDLRVENIAVRDNGLGGVLGGAATHDDPRITVLDSQVSNNGGFGVDCFNNGGTLRIENTIITGNASAGVVGLECGTTLANVTITGNGQGFSGIYLRMTNSDVSGNTGRGINAEGFGFCSQGYLCPRRLRIEDSTVDDNGAEGIFARAGVFLLRSSVSGNGADGIFDSGSVFNPNRELCSSVLIRESAINGNTGSGLRSGGRSAKIDQSDVTGNGSSGVDGFDGCQGRVKVQVSNSTIDGNALYGVRADALDRCTVRASDCQITGNGTDADCGVTLTCADVASCSLPSVRDTSCETSYDLGSGFPGTSWGVCSLD